MEENINIDEEEEKINLEKSKWNLLKPEIKNKIKRKLQNIFHNTIEKRYLLRIAISFKKWKQNCNIKDKDYDNEEKDNNIEIKKKTTRKIKKKLTSKKKG